MTGFYIKRIVDSGYVGMMMTATDAFLIPFGSRKPFFGTNPIAIGFPTDGIPVILDMATTSIPYGKIAMAKTEGSAIPSDWGFNSEGNPTTDPNAIAGLHPIAGPKGSGLAMVIDIFSSVLSGMAWGPHVNAMYGELDSPRKLGHFVMAIDVNRFMPLNIFKQRLGDMLNEFGNLPPADGFSQVFYPGQIEGLRREQRLAEGIPIPPGLFNEFGDNYENRGSTQKPALAIPVFKLFPHDSVFIIMPNIFKASLSYISHTCSFWITGINFPIRINKKQETTGKTYKEFFCRIWIKNKVYSILIIVLIKIFK